MVSDSDTISESSINTQTTISTTIISSKETDTSILTSTTTSSIINTNILVDSSNIYPTTSTTIPITEKVSNISPTIIPSTEEVSNTSIIIETTIPSTEEVSNTSPATIPLTEEISNTSILIETTIPTTEKVSNTSILEETTIHTIEKVSNTSIIIETTIPTSTYNETVSNTSIIIETIIPTSNYNGTESNTSIIIETTIPTTIHIEKTTNVQISTDISTILSNELPIFTIESINQEGCSSSGKLTFQGKISESISKSVQFKLPLAKPEGITLSCTLNGIQLECEVDRLLSSTISINETTIQQENEDIMVIESFESKEQINCANALIEKASNKYSVNTTFRQVSHFQKNDQDYSFSFYLITIMSESYNKGYQLNLKMNLRINGDLVQKNSSCILQDDVTASIRELSQGNFICSVKLSSSEYSNTDFENITISKENEEINGVSDLDEILSNPYKTDLAIEEVKRKKANNEEIPELGNIVDFYEEEVKITPSFIIDSVDMDECGSTGKFIFKGSFTDDITESIKFDLLMTYPESEVKCEYIEAKKNENVEMTCKVHEGFKSVEA